MNLSEVQLHGKSREKHLLKRRSMHPANNLGHPKKKYVPCNLGRREHEILSLHQLA